MVQANGALHPPSEMRMLLIVASISECVSPYNLGHEAHEANQDQINCYNVVEYAGIHENQDAGDDRKNRSQVWIH